MKTFLDATLFASMMFSDWYSLCHRGNMPARCDVKVCTQHISDRVSAPDRCQARYFEY